MTTSMLPSVTLPRFVSSSDATGAPQSSGNALFADGAGDLDFDMLAEYLLDEGGTTSGGSDVLGLSAFDFR